MGPAGGKSACLRASGMVASRQMSEEGWFKVSRRLLDSSRWYREEPQTIKLLVFLVAQAQDPLNEEPGTVRIGDTGLANRTGLTVEYVRKAIDRLASPDPESRSVGNDPEGRTLERVPGGVRLINFDLYHPGMVENAMYKKAARIEKARHAAIARWQKARQREAESRQPGEDA